VKLLLDEKLSGVCAFLHEASPGSSQVTPTLLTWGRDDRVSPLDRALLPMRLIPKYELHVLHDRGH